MSYRLRIAVALSFLSTAPAAFAQGEVVITHAKALAGNVTPGDAAGYPVSLTRPGSYILASNLTVPANKIGITINSHDITLDLNGFRLSGGYAGWYGILAGSTSNGVTVRNGTIAHFKYDGIIAANSDYWALDNLRVVVNQRDGVRGRNHWIVRNSQFGANTHDGLNVENYANIHGNVITGNQYGLYCDVGCHVEGNNISGQSQNGVTIRSGSLLGNTIVGNSYFGAYAETADVGFGNNVLHGNFGSNPETAGWIMKPLQPNYCEECP